MDDLPSRIVEFSDSRLITLSDNPDDLITLEELERRYVNHVLKSVNGNKTAAARILGLDRKTLYRKISGSSDSSGSTRHN